MFIYGPFPGKGTWTAGTDGWVVSAARGSNRGAGRRVGGGVGQQPEMCITSLPLVGILVLLLLMTVFIGSVWGLYGGVLWSIAMVVYAMAMERVDKDMVSVECKTFSEHQYSVFLQFSHTISFFRVSIKSKSIYQKRKFIYTIWVTMRNMDRMHN